MNANNTKKIVMGYIDIVIPSLAALVFIAIPGKLIKNTDASYVKKKSFLKKAGYVLITVAVLYFIVKTFGR